MYRLIMVTHAWILLIYTSNEKAVLCCSETVDGYKLSCNHVPGFSFSEDNPSLFQDLSLGSQKSMGAMVAAEVTVEILESVAIQV
jgi:hypothetical protein